MSPQINRAWFTDQLHGKKISQRQLAKNLGLDPSAITHILNGKRKITNDEANQIACLLSLPVTEVLRNAGVEVQEDVRRIAITGYVDGDAHVHLLPTGSHDYINGPADVPRDAQCLQVRHLGAQFDGWNLFVASEQLPPLSVVDRAALICLHDGRLVTGVIRRGYKAGTFNISSLPYWRAMENQLINWASPILWLKPI